MKIGIIGAGKIGEVLARRLAALGHEVSVANSRGPETLAELAEQTGAHAATAQEAARGKDLVVVTIPEKAVPDLPAELFEGEPDGLVIVDTGNYYPQRDGRIAPIEDGLPESSWVAEQLGRPVIKAFNTIQFQHLLELGQPPDSATRIALPVAGDSAAGKRAVLALVEQLGFDAVDAGRLMDSWRQQPGTPVYGADLDADGVRQALSEAVPSRP